MSSALFHYFQTDISEIPLPDKFTFPFYYEPHELSRLAAKELQDYLENQQDFIHNFGIEENQQGLEIGKMFGVLVVEKPNSELGFLCAFSGKLAESNQLKYFVPTVFDMLKEDSYFKKEEVVLNDFNKQIADLETDENYLVAQEKLEEFQLQSEKEIGEQKQKIKLGKKIRTEKRKNASEEQLEILNKESQEEGILLKKMTQYWNHKITAATADVEVFTRQIENLKTQRKQKSSQLQKQLFSDYAFLNQYNELKSLGEIFNGNPPAGAGECAAPKLLHFAFQNQLKPIAMAEFWWGKSPKSEVRKHKQFYPACTGKCEPILKHMLQDIIMDENPFTVNAAVGKKLEIIFEDDYLLLVNKPEEFLSVPGKLVHDSVQERIKNICPNAMIVHRLDMSTSGILLIAKSFEIYKKLQHQFIKRQVNKRYVALLDGIINENEGEINLPLRVDLDNRPFQIVCFEHGKPAKTKWNVIDRKDGKTLVHFYPISGRTHQLRIHAAHPLGLNTPIIGDDLYGAKANRLHLHAEEISFQHPVSREIVTFIQKCSFSNLE
jgi:tRNA pseudouridine32 synthase / 23S rRNA pseudouridine746 synthase